VARELSISKTTATHALKTAGITGESFRVLETALAARRQDDLADLERMAEGLAPTNEIVRRAIGVVACQRGESLRDSAARFAMNLISVCDWLRSFSTLGPYGILKLVKSETPIVRKSRPPASDLVSGPLLAGRDRRPISGVAEELGLSTGSATAALREEGIRFRPARPPAFSWPAFSWME
jgi:hypothetical protein